MFETVHEMTFHANLQGPEDAPALVLLHSLGTNLHLWDPQIEALAKHHRVLRIDMRGHGLTNTGLGPFSLDDLAGDVLALADRFGLARFAVAGVSIGGMIAQKLADRASERVEAIILIDTSAITASPPAWIARAKEVRARGIAHLADEIVSRWVTPDYFGTPQAEGLREMLRRTDAEGFARCAEALAQADLRQPSTTGVPALVVVGDKDLSTPLAAAKELAALRKGQLVELPGAAHIPNFEQPEAVSRVILEFLDTLPRTARDAA